MPARITLRRSCQSCVKAKRKCDLQMPSCGRCRQRRLRCQFDNEPLTAPSPPSAPPPRYVPALEDATTGDLNAFPERDMERFERESSPSTSSDDSSPEAEEKQITTFRDMAFANGTPSIDDPGVHLIRPFNAPTFFTLDDATTRYLLQTMRTLPTSFADSGQSLFIHPRVLQEIPVNRIASKIFSLCRYATKLRSASDRQVVSTELELRVQELINYFSRVRPGVQDLLVSVQALMLASITLGLGALSKGPVDVRTLKKRSSDLRVLGQWSTKLWNSAPWTLPNATSPEQSWLFAESVRRTLITSHLLTDVFAVLCTGSFKFTGFISTLPFDARHEWWDDVQGPPDGMGEDDLYGEKSKLVSYRQLVVRFEDGALTSREIGSFQKLMLVACRGYRTVCNRFGLPVPNTCFATGNQNTEPGWMNCRPAFHESLLPPLSAGYAF